MGDNYPLGTEPHAPAWILYLSTLLGVEMTVEGLV